MPADPNRVQAVFLGAIEVPVAARIAYLDRECGPDADLRARVEALLIAHDEPGSLVSEAAPALGTIEPPSPDAVSGDRGTVDLPSGDAATGTFDPDAHRPKSMASGAHDPHGPTDTYDVPPARRDRAPAVALGTVIAGRYTLVEVIGEGGMGSVYRATQSEPVKRQVALKLIKSGMDSKGVLARFDAERQALALMDHPNIARIYDGGLTPTGQPFFVMELVNGVPLTDYCDSKRLSVDARLQLFVSVCQAVQHAHQKGIIHRDLKPGNVLVTEVDGRPTPKVIDFGVAKATELKLTDLSFADVGAIVGTPAYMSPEQADPSSMDIDTRTDVYALGVILYELLTGSPPIESKQFKRGAILEMLRMVREVEPPRPSTRLSADDARPNVAANRSIEPARLAKLLQGELDWVVMKALEKDRTRRYDTANGLAADVQRYLADEVVEARPPSAGYRLKKFVRRHKGQVIAAGLVLFVLLGGIIGTSIGLVRADHEREKAEGLSDKNAKLAIEERDAKNKATDLAAANAQLAEDESRAKNKAVEATREVAYRLGISDFLLARAAYDKCDLKLAAERLDKVPEKQRDWEWKYLKQQIRGGLFTLNAGAVTSVAFSPDGTRIVSGGPNAVKVWDARAGTLQLELKGVPPPRNLNFATMRVSFSPDGTRIATSGFDTPAVVWDASTGERAHTLKHQGGRVSFSPDGTLIVTDCADGTAEVWNTRTGMLLLELKGHTRRVLGASFSPDGKRIVSASADGTVKVWEVPSARPEGFAQTGAAVLDLKGHTNAVTSVAFSPDGKRIVTASGDGSVKVWDAEKAGEALLDVKGIASGQQTMVVSPDGTRIATRRYDGTVTVVDARTGTIERILKPHASARQQMTRAQLGLNPDGTMAFSPDGTRIATLSGHSGEPGMVTVWDARTGAELLELKGHTSTVMSVAFSPDGTHILTGSVDGTVKVWDAGLPTGSEAVRVADGSGSGRLDLHGDWEDVLGVAFSPDGTRIVTADGVFEGPFRDRKATKPSAATVWDARTGQALVVLKRFKGTVKSVAFSPDGSRVVTGGAVFDKVSDARGGHPVNVGEAMVWEVPSARPEGFARTGATLLELRGLKEGVNSVAFSPDGTRIVTGAFQDMAFGGTEVKVWDARTGTELHDLTEQTTADHVFADERGGSVSFSRDGTRILIAGIRDKKRPDGHCAKVCDARTGTVLVELQGDVGPVLNASFSPDDTRIVTAGFGTVKVWDARTGAAVEPFELKGHTGHVNSVAFNKDGTRILTGSGDRTVKVWDARTGTELLELQGHTGFVMSASFSPDGTRIVAGGCGEGGKPGEVIVWNARTDKESPDEEELAYRRLQTRPNPFCYREGYLTARAARDDFAARFYLDLLPPAERAALTGKADLDALAPLTNRAAAHLKAGELEQALPLLVEIANVTKAKLGPEDPATLEALTQLGDAYGRMKRFDESIPVFAEVLNGQEAKLGRGHPVTLGTVWTLGERYKNAGRFKEAIPLLEEAHQHGGRDGFVLGEAYAKAGEYARLTKFIRNELAEARNPLLRPDLEPEGIEMGLGSLAMRLAELSVPLLQSKAFAEAEVLLRECLPLCEKTAPDYWKTFNAKSLLGGALLGQQKYADAEPLLLIGYEGLKQREKKILPEVTRNAVVPEALDRLIEFYTATDKPDEVTKWRAERARYAPAPLPVAPPPREKV